MKMIQMFILAVGLLRGLAIAQPRYVITDLGTLGGTYSYSYGINNGGLVTGGAATASQSGGVSQTGFLWSGGKMVNLGTLGGAACPSCNSQGAAASANGDVAIFSETSTMDPNGEDFCGFGTHKQCLAGIWKNGTMTAFPMLGGGQNSQAYWINQSGDTIGFSENGTLDATCGVPFQVRRFEAVKWTLDGKIQELLPLQGDTVSFAFGINDTGQAVGVSGLCSNVFLPPFGIPNGPHAVLWEKDLTRINLGTLPGGLTTVPTSINNRGEVVGNVQFADGTVHPFLWTKKDGMQDLGVPSGDFVAVAPCCGTLNNRDDVVGFSCPGPLGTCRAVLLRNQKWTDLNDLAPGSPMYLLSANSINDAGQIAGTGLVTSSGEVHAFLATPQGN
jgi:probable HAF family extracellular repeat protein